MCLRAIFLDGPATPPLPRRGVFASYRFILNSSTSGSLNLVIRHPQNNLVNGYLSYLPPVAGCVNRLLNSFDSDGTQKYSQISAFGSNSMVPVFVHGLVYT